MNSPGFSSSGVASGIGCRARAAPRGAARAAPRRGGGQPGGSESLRAGRHAPGADGHAAGSPEVSGFARGEEAGIGGLGERGGGAT